MSKIIAIETATEACSAALLIDDKNSDKPAEIIHRFQIAPREHTKLILPMLDEVIEEAGIQLAEVDAIAFGRGPGAFTGLRIATGIAQGLALSIDKPLLAISSLKAMANAAYKLQTTICGKTIFVAIDARMGEVYWAKYIATRDGVILDGEEQLSAPLDLFTAAIIGSQSSEVCFIGSGWDTYLEQFENELTLKHFQFIENSFPDAKDICQLALTEFANKNFQTLEEAQPTYLRNNVAEKPKVRS